MSTITRAAGSASAPARRLQQSMAAVRLAFTWLGVRKTLTNEQKAEAAESFGAEGQFLSAAKKLLDTRHPAYKTVTSVRNRAVSYWRGVTLPYPEAGLRLIRPDRVASFDAHMSQFRDELDEAVEQLDGEYAELKSQARERLGRLYDPADYPPQLRGLFELEWSFPSVEPPSYLLQLKPELYEQERARAAARFEEAVQLAEQAFTDELSKLVAHLGERLSGAGSADGKPKVFRDSAVTNLREFFTRFRELNVRSNPELDELVDRARKLMGDVAPDDLRESAPMRERLAAQLAGVRTSLDELLVDRPRRRILRQREAVA
ncbi:MAG: hypothetical protein WBD40_22095 [Tepidisphaeraceae bacterium]